MVQIYCKNCNSTKEFPEGTSLLDIYRGFNLQMPYGAVSAKVNNKVEGLNFKVFYSKDVEFLDITSASGMRTYFRFQLAGRGGSPAGDAAGENRPDGTPARRGLRKMRGSPPVVPKGQARIRVQVSAGHTFEQLDRCIAAFIKVGKELNVLK